MNDKKTGMLGSGAFTGRLRLSRFFIYPEEDAFFFLPNFIVRFSMKETPAMQVE